MKNDHWIGDRLTVCLDPCEGEVATAVSVGVTLTVTRSDLPLGTGILVSLLGPHAWPPLLGPNDPADPGRRCPVSVELPSRVAGRVEVDNRGLRRAISLRIERGNLRCGDRIQIQLGDARGPVRLPPFDCRIRVAVFLLPPAGDPVEVSDPPYYQVSPGPARRIRLLVASQAAAGTPGWIHARLVDRFGNTASRFTGTLGLTATDASAEVSATLEFAPEHQGIRRIPDGLTWRTIGIHRLVARQAGSDLEAASNPAEVVASLDSVPRLVWGDFHGHTYLSDGLEGPDVYYRYARDVEALDFSGISDHAYGHREVWEDYGGLRDDSSALAFRKGTPPSTYPHWTSRLIRWGLTKAAATAYHDPGRFVTFVGFEWNSGQPWEPNFGAKCVYFPGESGPMLTYFDPEGADPHRLWETLRPTGAITIPHHTAYPINGVPPGVDWRYHDEVMQPVVEIYSKHGASEYFGNPYPPAKVERGNFVQDALARGHRIGFIAGSDTHISRPGSDCVEKESGYYRQGGLAAVYTTTLTRRGILEALRARRCYGTTNARIILRFDVDGHQMGEVCHAVRAQRERRDITIFVAGTATLRAVEVLRDNRVVHSWTPEAMEGTFRWRDDTPLYHSVFYYVRITQTDGEIAWASPVWIHLPGSE